MSDIIRKNEKKMVVGFWLRFASDGLDFFILSILGFLISYPLREYLYPLGQNGWWIGLIVTFLYTGFLQTSFGSGQSLAKKVFRIQVIKLDGTFMSLTESFLRYSVLAFIAYNG